MEKRRRPDKLRPSLTKHLLCGTEESSWLMETIARRRGGLSNSALIRLLIYEEAARLGIRVEDLRSERETESVREPGPVG